MTQYYGKFAFLNHIVFNSRVPKESMGISPMGYIMNMRVRTACELLSNTNLTLAAVAENVGITDVNYFCRMIKKYTGNTPGHYRK